MYLQGGLLIDTLGDTQVLHGTARRRLLYKDAVARQQKVSEESVVKDNSWGFPLSFILDRDQF